MNSVIKALLLLMITCQAWAGDGVSVTGKLVPGGHAQVHAPAGSVLRYGGHVIKFDALEALPIGFARDQQQAKLVVTLPNGKRIVKTLALKPRTYDIQRINGLKKKYVSPDEKTLKQIYADIAAAKAARKLFLRQPKGWQETFAWPTYGVVSGVYGSQRILNGKPRRPHYGVDIAAPTGTPVFAPASGKVTLAQKMVLSGNTLMIDHGYGLRSTFMHLHKLLVKPGDWVHKGQKVAEVGATGRATGPHLHWGMSWFNVRLDPATFVSEQPLKKGVKISKAQTAGFAGK